MGQQTIFSVIIPVYNADGFLNNTLSRLPYGNLFRFIFIDDGSTDNSAAILREYCGKDNRATLLCQPHSGTSAARNNGIDAADGDYIMFLDSDDYIFRNAYDVLVNLTEDNPDIVVFGARVVNHDSSKTINTIEPRDVVYKPFNPDALFNEVGSKPYVWNCAYKRQFLKENNLRFSTRLNVGEDMLFQFCAMPKAQMIRFSSDKLYCYNYLKYGSVMESYDKNADMRAQSSVKVVDLIIDSWQAQTYYERYKNQLLNWVYEFLSDDFRKLSGKEYKVYSLQLRQVFKRHGVKLKKLKLPLKRKLRLYGLTHKHCRFLAEYKKG